MQWRTHILGCHGIIFVVDISDFEKFHEVKTEIDVLMAHQFIRNTVVLILFNKKDLFSEQIPDNDILLKIKISNRTIQANNICIHQVSIMTGDGLEEAFNKLYTAMNLHVSKFL